MVSAIGLYFMLDSVIIGTLRPSDILVLRLILVLVLIQFYKKNNLSFNFSFSSVKCRCIDPSLLYKVRQRSCDVGGIPVIIIIIIIINDEAIRIAVAYRLGCKACEPHTCVCGKPVDARALHGLSCRKGRFPLPEFTGRVHGPS